MSNAIEMSSKIRVWAVIGYTISSAAGNFKYSGFSGNGVGKGPNQTGWKENKIVMRDRKIVFQRNVTGEEINTTGILIHGFILYCFTYLRASKLQTLLNMKF